MTIDCLNMPYDMKKVNQDNLAIGVDFKGVDELQALE